LDIEILKTKILNSFYRLSPSIIRLLVVSYLFSDGMDDLLFQFGVINGLAIAYAIFFSLDLHHSLMGIIPITENKNKKLNFNISYLSIQIINCFFGSLIFSFLIFGDFDISLSLSFILFFSEFLILEINRILIINELAVKASLLAFVKSILTLLITIIFILDDITLEKLFLAVVLSNIISVAFILKSFIFSYFNKFVHSFKFNQIRTSYRLFLNKESILLLLGTFSLRYLQVLDREYIGELVGVESGSRYIFFMGMGMFIYRIIDAWSFQIIIPKLISVRSKLGELNHKKEYLKELKQVFLLLFISSIVVYILGYLYIHLLRPSVIVFYHSEMIIVVGCVIFFTINILMQLYIYTLDKKKITAVNNILSLLIFIVTVNLMAYYNYASFNSILFSLIFSYFFPVSTYLIINKFLK